MKKLDKIVLILRGIPGCGKSSVADWISFIYPNSVVCSADDYFTDSDGNYNFNKERIGNAHGYCKWKFTNFMQVEQPVIIVSNTNTTNSDVNWYRSRAVELNYTVFVAVIENRHDGNDIHLVPEEVKERMKQQLKESIKL